MWQLNIPGVPTFNKGTSPDATVMAIGTYLPDGLLPIDEVEGGEQELSEWFPAYVAGQPFLGDHMALFLPLQAFRPYTRGAVRACNIKELSATERDKKNKLLREAIAVDRKKSIALRSRCDSNSSDTYHILPGILGSKQNYAQGAEEIYRTIYNWEFH